MPELLDDSNESSTLELSLAETFLINTIPIVGT